MNSSKSLKIKTFKVMSDAVYLDNASTSYPKPMVVVDAIQKYITEAGCSPGRSGYALARKSEEIIGSSRKQLGKLLDCSEYQNISFTYNATYALNFAIKGFLKKGDHVVTTCMEHNSVLRPLERLKRSGIIDYTVVGLGKDGLLDMGMFIKSFRDSTTLVAVTHASNVTGVINPISEIISYAHECGVKVLVDASQTVGFLDISIDELDVDFLAFTGHKSLLGLPGLGGLYVKDADDLETTIEGGTGANSYSLVQPGSLPEKFEAGTCNYTGIAALGASIAYLMEKDMSEIRKCERELSQYVTSRMKEIIGVKVYGDVDINAKVPVLSFTIDNIPANEVSTLLDSEYNIMTRPGLQCAPLVHKALGTHPVGTVRVSLGIESTKMDCDRLIEAVAKIIKDRSV